MTVSHKIVSLFFGRLVLSDAAVALNLRSPGTQLAKKNHTLHSFLASLSSSTAILPTPLRCRTAEQQSLEQPD